MARQRAVLIVARKAGEDPPAARAAAGGPTVDELAEHWLEEHVGTRCKPSTAETYRLVVKFRERVRDRFLSEEEFRRLGRVLDEAETCKGVSVHAVYGVGTKADLLCWAAGVPADREIERGRAGHVTV